MAFALKARRHRKHTLDDPLHMIDPIHYCVLFIPFGQIFPCGHIDNDDPIVTVIYLHLWWSCFCFPLYDFGKAKFQAFRGASWRRLFPKMSCCNGGLQPSFASGLRLLFFPQFHFFSPGLKTTLTRFIVFSFQFVFAIAYLFRCACCTSTCTGENVETGGVKEEKEERERKSKMFDTVFVPAAASNLTTVSWLLSRECRVPWMDKTKIHVEFWCHKFHNTFGGFTPLWLIYLSIRLYDTVMNIFYSIRMRNKTCANVNVPFPSLPHLPSRCLWKVNFFGNFPPWYSSGNHLYMRGVAFPLPPPPAPDLVNWIVNS